MALHGLYQVGQRCLQELPADAVLSFPNQDRRLTYRHGVDPSSPDCANLLHSVFRKGQQLDAMLAVMADGRDELVEDRLLSFRDDAR